jgi:hypothetical protein
MVSRPRMVPERKRSGHPLYRTLKAVREEAAKWARAQSILPNPGIGGTHIDW